MIKKSIHSFSQRTLLLKCRSVKAGIVIKVTQRSVLTVRACVFGRRGGYQGSREGHTPAKGGTIPKVTHITSPELCPDTPFTFFLSLSPCLSLFLCQAVLSARLFFITIKGQPEPKDREPYPEFKQQHIHFFPPTPTHYFCGR